MSVIVVDSSRQIKGWDANVAFIPAKQIGVVALCSCDATDADMGSFNWVLLRLAAPKTLTLGSEVRLHTAGVALPK